MMTAILSLLLLQNPTPANDKIDFDELTKHFFEGMERALKAVEDGEMEPRICLFGYCASCKDYHSPAQCSVSCTISGPGWICDGACTSDLGCGGKCY